MQYLGSSPSAPTIREVPDLRYPKYLRLARERATELSPNHPKQHIVVCLGFEGKKLLVETANTLDHHAEELCLRRVDFLNSLDRLIVYRFNRQDLEKYPRTSCPCWSCVPLIMNSYVRKVEYMSPMGVVCCKIGDLRPYNQRYTRPNRVKT